MTTPKRTFLKDGKPFTPATARQSAAQAQQRPPQRPAPIPSKRGPEVPGSHRRAPAAAAEAFERIQASRERNINLQQQLADQQSFKNLRPAPEQPQEQAPAKQPRRGVAITPVQNGQAVRTQPPVATLPPTEQLKPLAQKEGFVLDERYQELYLPSKFLAYDFKRLHVRQMTRGEIKAIIRAKSAGSYRHLINAIGQTLDVDPYVLTLGDFWYIMYWHRINSYKKSPFIVQWDCKEEKHVARTDLPKENDDGTPNGQYLAKATLKNTLTIDRSNIKETAIDQEKYLAIATHLYDTYGLQVTPQTMADFADMMEAEEEEQLRQTAKQHKLGKTEPEDDDEIFKILLELQEDVADAEVRIFGYRYAMLLSRVHGATIQERDDFLDQFPPEVTDDLEEFLQAAEHGVNESFRVQCSGCGVSREVTSSLDTLSFLPAYINAGDA